MFYRLGKKTQKKRGGGTNPRGGGGGGGGQKPPSPPPPPPPHPSTLNNVRPRVKSFSMLVVIDTFDINCLIILQFQTTV